MAKSCKVLMVDDSADDRALFASASKRARCTLELLHAVEDGASAINYLKGVGPFADRTLHPYPDLVVLDLKMPLRTGWDVLEWLKDQRERPVTIILSGSDHKDDIQKALGLGADYYHVKPPELDGWVTTVKELEQYMARRGQ